MLSDDNHFIALSLKSLRMVLNNLHVCLFIVMKISLFNKLLLGRFHGFVTVEILTYFFLPTKIYGFEILFNITHVYSPRAYDRDISILKGDLCRKTIISNDTAG